MNPELTAVIFSLLSAAAFGTGDFFGGVATRRVGLMLSVLVVEAVGLLLMLVLAIGTREPISSTSDLMWGGAAGVFGTVGLLSLYRALAGGKMGLAAPVSAALGAAIPVAFGLITEGSPGITPIIGFVVALMSIWLVTYSTTGSTSGDNRSLAIAAFAGMMFGIFYVALNQIQPGAVFWPLVIARLVAVILTVCVFMMAKRSEARPQRWLFGLMLIGGVLDISGNVFFLIANGSGRLDIAAVLTALYPAMTVILARFILKEALTRTQMIGVLGALVAIVLIVL